MPLLSNKVARLPASGAGELISPFLSATAVATILAALFGARARTVCAWYAVAARHSAREGDYRLWLTAFKHLQSNKIENHI